MPLRPYSRGLSRYRREPVRGSDAKLGLPWDAYYVLTKAEARLTNSKIHPNTGSPDYNITHDHTTDFTNVGTNTHAQLDTHKSSDGTDHSGVNGVVTIHSDVTDAGSGLIITETERTDLNTALIHVGSDGTDHTFIDQDVRTSAGPSFDELTITSPTQDFKFLQPTAINGSIAWQGQTSGTATRFGFFSKDGDGTDHVIFDIYGVGVPDDFTGLENMVIGYLNSGVFIVRSSTNEIQLRSGSGADHIQMHTSKAMTFPAGNVTATGGDFITTGTHEHRQVKCKMTAIGGFAILLQNRTGADSVAGQLVRASAANDDAVVLTGAIDDECFGVFLDDDVENMDNAWVVVAGIANVMFDDNVAAVRANWVGTGQAGLARTQAAPPALGVAAHFEEVGHCIESVSAGGGGTFIKAKCVLQFN
ncbi:hypothetical protein LCGC14_1251020 [marine sediment metagenome]|uniref:Uncharacterized protein n=1 Tax=marine sediment metagenome TaxID=412755 RepID=A0A0F9L330_9ZZZZ